MSEGPVEIDRSGRLYLERILAHNRDPDGGDSLPLDLPLDKSHGLIADASPRGKQNDIHAVLPEFPGDVRSAPVDERYDVLPDNVPHEPVMPVGKPADYALLRKLPEPVDREYDIDIAVRILVVVIVMSDHEAVGRARVIDHTVGWISLPVDHVKRLLVAMVHAGGGNERHGAGR